MDLRHLIFKWLISFCHLLYTNWRTEDSSIYKLHTWMQIITAIFVQSFGLKLDIWQWSSGPGFTNNLYSCREDHKQQYRSDISTVVSKNINSTKDPTHFKRSEAGITHPKRFWEIIPCISSLLSDVKPLFEVPWCQQIDTLCKARVDHAFHKQGEKAYTDVTAFFRLRLKNEDMPLWTSLTFTHYHNNAEVHSDGWCTHLHPVFRHDLP
jgi:hypothetical protein